MKQEEKNKKQHSKGSMEIELIFSDLSKRKNKYKLILLISALEFISRFIDLIIYIIFETKRARNGEIAWLISFDFLSRVISSHYL